MDEEKIYKFGVDLIFRMWQLVSECQAMPKRNLKKLEWKLNT